MEKEIREEEISETADSDLEATQEVMEETAMPNELESLEDQLLKKEAELQKCINQQQRLQADFINYKKRVEKEKSEIYLYANEKIALDLLSIVDNLERAMEASDNKVADEGLYQGIQLVMKQLKETLIKHDIEEIEALNQPFDMNFHHAVMQEESEVESNTVIEVFQKGYKINTKVLRPAMVKVSK